MANQVCCIPYQCKNGEVRIFCRTITNDEVYGSDCKANDLERILVCGFKLGELQRVGNTISSSNRKFKVTNVKGNKTTLVDSNGKVFSITIIKPLQDKDIKKCCSTVTCSGNSTNEGLEITICYNTNEDVECIPSNSSEFLTALLRLCGTKLGRVNEVNTPLGKLKVTSNSNNVIKLTGPKGITATIKKKSVLGTGHWIKGKDGKTIFL